MSVRGWQGLGSPPPDALSDARLQLHHAAQIVAAVGLTYRDPRPDDSHPNLGWSDAHGALVGHPVPAAGGVQSGLRLDEPALLVIDAGGAIRETLALDGQTIDSAHAWLAPAIATAGGGDPRPLERTAYELPPHPVALGERFSTRSRDAFAELGRWYANADLVIGEIVGSTPDASPLRCWPHHFDIGTLVVVGPGADAESTRSFGIGMTPGDASYPDPYWYVTPWPYPESPDLAPLGGGAHWHSEGWLGAVLTAPALLEAPDGEAQASRVREFLREAGSTARALVAQGEDTLASSRDSGRSPESRS